jgi:hypothetical protein
VAARRRVHERVSHRETVGQRKVRRLQREGFVDRSDGRAPQGGDGFERPLLGQIPADNLVDLVDFDRRYEKRLRAFEVASEAGGSRPIGEVLDPAA